MKNVESRRNSLACYGISPSNTQKQKSLRSPAWENFTALPGGKKAECNYCRKQIKCKSGTWCLNSHKNRCKSYKKIQESENNKVLALEGTTSDNKDKFGVVSGFCQMKCRQATLKMIILDNLSFSFVENQGYRNFCSQALPLYKVPSRRSITKDLFKLFLNEKASLKSMFSGKRVSFTTYMWTSITKVSYMVITAHFIDENWNLHRKIINFNPIHDYKGNTIAKQFEKCLVDWNINKVFTITVDNCHVNEHALNLLKTKCKKSLGADGLILDGEFMHVRCVTHILNLIVGEGLKKVSGSVISIRNAVNYVRASSSRLRAFQMKVDGEKLSRGSLNPGYGTKWQATFFMLRSALKFKTAFDRMAEEDKLYIAYFHEEDTSTRQKRVGPPSSKDWDNARVMVEFLKAFYESTLTFSASNKVTSNMCYSEICNIESVLRTFAESSDSNIVLKNVAHAMKYEKFDKYWEGLEKINKLFIVASILDPRLKMKILMHYFENIYGKGSQGNKKCVEMKEMLMSLLRKLYIVYNSSSENSINLVNDIGNQGDGISIIDARSQELDKEFYLSDASDQIGVEYNFFREWSQMPRDRKIVDDPFNEIDIYLMEKIVKPKDNNLGCEYDILDWWKVNNANYPVLARMAKDIFAIPISTVSSESGFSAACNILDEGRTCLTSSSLESLVLTQNWLQSSPQFKV